MKCLFSVSHDRIPALVGSYAFGVVSGLNIIYEFIFTGLILMIDVVAAVILNKNLCLSAKRIEGKHLAGHWEFPGGKIEPGETPEQCLKRELKEEFTIESEIGEFVAESIFDYDDKRIRLLAYKVKHVSDEFQLIHHDEIRWLPIEELDSLKWAPTNYHIIESLKQQAKAYYDETLADDMNNRLLVEN